MSEEKPLEGQVALVPGASRGIGKGVAIELATSRAKVYFTGRTTTEDPQRPGTVERTEREIQQQGGRAVGLVCDHHVDAEVRARRRSRSAPSSGRSSVEPHAQLAT